MEKSGAYLDGVRPGDETKKLVSHAVNALVILWAFHLTLLAMCFDNTVFSLVGNDNSLETASSLISLKKYDCQSFFSLLATVSTAIDLSKQIRKKYDHSKFYD